MIRISWDFKRIYINFSIDRGIFANTSHWTYVTDKYRRHYNIGKMQFKH